MKIKRGKKTVTSSEEMLPMVIDHQDAINCIQDAIDLLAAYPDDQVCRDSIANLGVVILDLNGGADQSQPEESGSEDEGASSEEEESGSSAAEVNIDIEIESEDE